MDTDFFPPSVLAMSIITGRGDQGQTDLMFGKRIEKTSMRVEVLGTIDELNAALGLARAAGLEQEVEEIVDRVQDMLVGLMGQLACQPGDEERYAAAGYQSLLVEDQVWVEKTAKAFEKRGVTFKGWARPGVEHSIGRAGLDVARTVARRSERAVLQLHEILLLKEDGSEVPEHIRLFFNRLSDLLWILARVNAETPR
jgi:cob(I)alamin adenosyltransferase